MKAKRGFELPQLYYHVAVYEPWIQTRAYDCTLMGLVGTGCQSKYWGISVYKNVL